VNGLLCGEGDVHAMAAHLQTLGNDVSLAVRMGKSGRERAEKHHQLKPSLIALEGIIGNAVR
jgi:glycosyltransferase involved in cell wall biosynthesis